MAEEDYGKYGKLRLSEDEIPIRPEMLKFPSSSEDRPCLSGGRCESCGDVCFPRRHFCPKCGSEVKEFSFGSFGEVVTYSIVYQGGMGIEPPYIVAMVSFPEINDPELGIISRIIDCPIGDIRIGMKVELVIGKVRSTFLGEIAESFGMPGQSIVGFIYRPVKEEK